MSGTLKVTTLQDGASSTANMTFDSSGNATVGNNLTVTGTAAMASSFKRNRIINGNMLIDQRNAGASVSTSVGTFIYTVDRWQAIYAATSKYTIQQNAGSVALPAGFTKYLGVTSASAYTPSSTEYFAIRQFIEGYNTADLAWGTASAKPITLSFVVYSSLTGNFGGALVNSAQTRSYPFTYNVPSANTWTTISVTIAGDTSGVWETTTSTGIDLRLGLGCGSTYNGTAGAWAAGNYVSATGAVSVVGTSGATFYITGVQLEVGTKATPYEMQIYSDQLAQCQRYYYQGFFLAGIWGGTAVQGLFSVPVPMRTTPTTGIGGTGVLNMNDTVTGVFSQSSGGWSISSQAAQNASAQYQTFYWAAVNFSGMTAYRMYYQSDYSGGLNNIATLSAEL